MSKSFNSFSGEGYMKYLKDNHTDIYIKKDSYINTQTKIAHFSKSDESQVWEIKPVQVTSGKYKFSIKNINA